MPETLVPLWPLVAPALATVVLMQAAALAAIGYLLDATKDGLD